VSGSLANPFAVKVYRFTIQSPVDLTIQLLATQKTQPSDVDTRASLYRVDDSEYLITNDDPPGGQTDSVITGPVTPGEYLLVVDNVNEDAKDLSFEVHFSAQ
jgi:hypothetical protein